MREMRTYGKVVSVEVELYKECKYTASKETFENAIRVQYNNLESWEIVTGDDATELGNMTDENSRDDNNEYLVLHFADGSEATFRNSYCDMFRVK